jgi:hypothetical protein
VELPERGVLSLTGEDRVHFLQGLVSNDVADVSPERAVYACLLTPQGKFLHDFFLIAAGEAILIECEASRRADLLRRLKMFKLRSRIELADVSGEYAVFAVIGARPFAPPAGGIVYDDPRSAGLGLRVLLPRGVAAAPLAALGLSRGTVETYDRLRIEAAVPDGSRDMEEGKAILLESNIDLLHGISWDKGCYMGQELTARTRYRGLIKKRLVPVRIAGKAPPIGTPLMENGREIGEMRSSAGDVGLALLKLDAIRDPREIKTDSATLVPRPPAHLTAILAETADA